MALALALAHGAAFRAVAQTPEAEPPAADPAPPTLSRGPDGSLRIANVSLEDALKLAQTWLVRGEPRLAEELLAQLAPIWPDDARIPFLLGLAARAQGDERAAVRHFRVALSIDPDADRVRYELARSYEALQQWDRAAFQLRFVLGSKAPDLVKRDVAQRLMAIADRKRWSASFEAAVAPSTNVNVAPSDAAIDPILGSENPAFLTEDSTAQSGLGGRFSGGLARQFPLAPDTPSRRVRGQIGAAGAITDYDQTAFDDSSVAGFAGASMWLGRNEVGGDLRGIRRWYGGELYEDAGVVRVYLERRIARPLWLRVQLSGAERDNAQRDDYDGFQTTGGVRLRWSLASSAYLAAEADVTRFDTDFAATSYWRAGATLSVYKDFRGGWSFELAPGYARHENDGPDPFFLKTRKDDRWALEGAVIRRDWAVLGFAPFVRYRYTRNESTLKLYDFEQHAAEVGFTGVF